MPALWNGNSCLNQLGLTERGKAAEVNFQQSATGKREPQSFRPSRPSPKPTSPPPRNPKIRLQNTRLDTSVGTVANTCSDVGTTLLTRAGARNSHSMKCPDSGKE